MRRLYLPAVTASATLEVILIFFNNYWTLKRLHSDEGANFTSRLTKELCNLYNKRNSRRTPYHPIGNIRGDMLGTLEPNKKTLKKKICLSHCSCVQQYTSGINRLHTISPHVCWGIQIAYKFGILDTFSQQETAIFKVCGEPDRIELVLKQNS